MDTRKQEYAQRGRELEEERRAAELAKWQAIFDHRKQRCQDAIDADEGIDTVQRLALEARAAQIDVDMVRRFGRPLNRAERRREGISVTFP